MDLEDWLWKNRMTKTDLAVLCCVTRKYIYDIFAKRAKPSEKLAKKMSKITNNEVTVEEIMRGCFNKRVAYYYFARKKKRQLQRKKSPDKGMPGDKLQMT